jgi:RNase P/RNase MRP subunit p30
LSYFEGRLKVNFENLDEIKETLKLCEKLRIKNLILEPENNILEINPKKKEYLQGLTKIKLFYRINLSGKNLREIKTKIKLCKNKQEVISIESTNQKIQEYVATDTRIDLLSFSDYHVLNSFSKGVLSLAIQNKKFIEFSLTPIMSNNRIYQSKAFRKLYRSIKLAINSHAKFIISGNFKDLYDLRNPRALISICHTLLGIPLGEAKKAFSKNVKLLLKNAEERTNKSIFEEGVELID